ncbi:phage tail protein [Alteraurantiacibacter buctensis]|uniref:Phage tail protein n=1 Tax=Alteraurantiacibacter buctensis TaxID=1503981 RepID=A0A844YZ09_9SPHN|nr:phage tail protein [Alteraurantiacibacter buctensis]MXO73565.1 phage tail protein [Alteraurantiacibacter buctensis]
MRKAEDLRAAIAEALPEFRGQPDRLRIWVEDGAGRSTQSNSLSFGFAYRLNVLLEETRSDIALLALAVFRWLRINQPDLLRPGADGFRFEVDVLDNSTSDILLQLDLKENVSVAPIDGGGWTLDYLAEPDPLWDDFLGAGDVDPIPDLTGHLIDEDPQ